ncbi:MFS transporter [Stappia sp. ICDLI1TA098]
MRLDRLRLVAILALGQIIGWGTTFDMPGVLGRLIAADLGMSNALAFGGLTAMMLVGGLSGPATGRAIERLGAARVLAAGAAAMAAGLVGLSVAQGPVVYYAAWVVAGIGGALGLSVPAHTAVVEREGAGAKGVIGLLMIFTGLSAAVFWPLWSLAAEAFGWRSALLIGAAAQLALCPLYLFALPRKREGSAETRAASLDEPLVMSPRQSRLAFALIAFVFVVFGLVTTGIAPSLIALLQASGASPALALQLGSLRSLLGITARLADMLAGRRASAVLSGLVAAGLLAGSPLILLFADGEVSLLFLFVAFYGFGSGISALTRALLPLQFFSAARYARAAASLSLPTNIAMATGPLAITLVLDNAGVAGAVAVTCGLSALAFAALVVLVAIARRAARPAAGAAGILPG